MFSAFGFGINVILSSISEVEEGSRDFFFCRSAREPRPWRMGGDKSTTYSVEDWTVKLTYSKNK